MTIDRTISLAGRALGPLLIACGGSSGTTSTETAATSTETDATSTSSSGSATTTAPPTGTTDTPTSGTNTSMDPTGGATTTGTMTVSRRVFITAASFPGDLAQAGAGIDGIDGADRLCATAATAASLGGDWLAWVSTSEVDALGRLPSDTRWTLVDATTEVFPSRSAIQFGPLHAIDMTETAASLPAAEMVWTNTTSFGKNSTDGQNNACDDWSAQTGVAAVGILFDPDLGGPGLSWTDTKQPQGCGAAFHLYCFEH